MYGFSGGSWRFRESCQKTKTKTKKASIMALFTLLELLNMKFVQMQ